MSISDNAWRVNAEWQVVEIEDQKKITKVRIETNRRVVIGNAG